MAKSILIVEDDEDTQLLYQTILQSEGYACSAAYSGGEAMTWLKEHGLPDMILLDLTLPGMSGTDFMLQLKEDTQWERVRVIMISGWDDLAERSRQLGAAGFLRKPFDLEGLLKEIKRHLKS